MIENDKKNDAENEKQTQWIQLQEKAKQRAIQFTHDPNLDGSTLLQYSLA